MKKTNLLYSILLMSLFFSACDKVENPFPETTSQPAECDTAVFATNTNTQRNVLLEDFTGHRCPNCPFAAYSAINLQASLESQGKNLIIVGEHVTDLAEPQSNPDNSFITDFRTEAGDNFGDLTNSYSEYFGGATGFSYVPIGLIDRAVYNASVLVDVGDWSNAINDRFLVPIGANIQMEINYDAAFDKACIYVETEFMQSMAGDYNLVIYIVEDSIVDWQINGPAGDPTYPLNTNVETYMHRHVMRGTVSGTWGTQIAVGGVSIGETNITGFNVAIESGWDPNHISFVAYVYNDATKEILQAIEEHLED
jgi:hypothetical protein